MFLVQRSKIESYYWNGFIFRYNTPIVRELIPYLNKPVNINECYYLVAFDIELCAATPPPPTFC